MDVKGVLKDKILLLISVFVILINGCGGDSSFTLSVNVAGLGDGSVDVKSSEGELITINRDGKYLYNNDFNSAALANVAIIKQPSAKICEITDSFVDDTLREKTVNIRCYGEPMPAELTVSYGTKKVILEWVDSSQYTSYSVLVDKDGIDKDGSDFERYSNNIEGKTFEFSINVYEYIGASLKVESCNPLGCVESDVSNLSSSLVEAIGYVTPDNDEDKYLFGSAIAISADANIVAVGAGVKVVSNQNLSRRYKSVYVYSVDEAGNWGQIDYLTPSDAVDVSSFGSAIAVSGDGNTIAVLAYGDTSAERRQGFIYVYTRQSDGKWLVQYTVKSDDVTSSGFGPTMTISDSGEYVVTTQQDLNYNYITVWKVVVVKLLEQDSYELTYLNSPTVRPDSSFGNALSISSNGEVLVVGANSDDKVLVTLGGSSNDTEVIEELFAYGGAYVYEQSDEQWVNTAKLKSASPSYDALFGSAVTVSGNGQHIAVGSPLYSLDAGKVDVFSNVNSNWMNTKLLQSPVSLQEPPVAAGEDTFGASLDFNADGSTLVIGASTDSGGDSGISNRSLVTSHMSRSGAIYVYRMQGEYNWEQHSYIKAKQVSDRELFGRNLAISETGTIVVSSGYQVVVDDESPFENAPGAFYLY